jgi:hypothetical protein
VEDDAVPAILALPRDTFGHFVAVGTFASVEEAELLDP